MTERTVSTGGGQYWEIFGDGPVECEMIFSIFTITNPGHTTWKKL